MQLVMQHCRLMGDRFSGGFFGDDRDWSISEVLGGGLGTMHGELSDWTASGRGLSSRRFVCRSSMAAAGLPPGSSWPTPAAGPSFDNLLEPGHFTGPGYQGSELSICHLRRPRI